MYKSPCAASHFSKLDSKVEGSAMSVTRAMTSEKLPVDHRIGSLSTAGTSSKPGKVWCNVMAKWLLNNTLPAPAAGR